MPQPEYVIRSYGGGAAAAQLVQQMGSSDSSFTITPTTGWVENGTTNPLGTSGPFTICIDDNSPSRETILCRSINLTSGLVTVFVDTDGWSGRGYDNTAAVAHVPGGTSSGVTPAWSSLEAEEANQAVYDILGAGGVSSLGVPIGTSIDFRGMPNAVPANFMYENGTAISRTTYSALLTALSMTFTGTTTNAGATITSVGTTTVNGATVNITSLLPVGGKIQLVNSGGAVYTISSVTATSIVLTSGVGVTAGTAGNVTFYPHGAGDGSTTFNIPDSRGRTTRGAGTVGTNSQPNTYVGITGGTQTVTISTTNMPSHNHAATVTDPQHYHAKAGTEYVVGIAPGQENSLNITGGGSSGPAGVTFTAATDNAATGITVATSNTGSGTALNVDSPYSVATKIIRIQ